MDYMGDEVAVARPLVWDAISPSLPDEVGCLVLRNFCEGGVLHYVGHFAQYTLPLEEQSIGKTPAVMVKPGDWEQVARGLLEKGLCEVDNLFMVYLQLETGVCG